VEAQAAGPQPRGRPRSERADAAILEVALRHLRERGYAEMSVEGVAAEAGVGKGTIYRRYRNKADLASAAFASVTADSFVHDPVPDDTREALVAHLRRFERGWSDMGLDMMASLLGERSDPELLELHRERVISRARARAAGILRRAQERGEIRPDAHLETAMSMLVGSLFARRLAGIEDEAWAESAVDTLMRGLAVPAADGSR
jgi:AcrR family transcriptional regulator